MAETPIKGHATVEALDGPAWRQTLKDFPVAVLATGVGYGLGKTLAEVAKHRASSGSMPGWAKYVPQTMAAVSMVGALASSRARGILKDRREEARREAKLKEAAAGLGHS